MDVSLEPGSQIEIAGVPLQVLSVSIVQNTEQADSTQPAPYRLVLMLKSTPVDGLELVNTSMSINPELLVSGLTESLPGNQERITIDLPQLPSYPFRLYFPHGEILLNGH